MVVGKSGKSEVSNARSSSGNFLTRYRNDPVYKLIEQKLAAWSHIPVENGEIMYLLRYQVGQQYRPHNDYFSDDETGRVHIGNQGQRIATALVYLNTPEAGGDTYFPKAGLSVEAKKGDAILFWDCDPFNNPDTMSLHGGKPIEKGIKWALVRWMREKRTNY
eukprot:TRINITY_DN1710_c0_g1_i1.p1 TRINITY_DN1710_c0_g1~~TRINITY_DN1710_c0_g1_i1.p1  ORF type:complete len:162 (+),score=44.12 TRINITY_DN1710_c0_g1_i1:621-1106(+)